MTSLSNHTFTCIEDLVANFCENDEKMPLLPWLSSARIQGFVQQS